MSSEQSRVSAMLFPFIFMSLFLLLLISLFSTNCSNRTMPVVFLNNFLTNILKETKGKK